MAKKKKLTVKQEKCKGCMLCLGVCPQKALAAAEEVNSRGMHFVILKHEDKCTKCGLCAIMCPDCAIEIIEEE